MVVLFFFFGFRGRWDVKTTAIFERVSVSFDAVKITKLAPPRDNILTSA